MHNTSDAAPLVHGENWVDLFKVEFERGFSGAGTELSIPTITKIANKKLAGQGNQYNLDAGGGLYIDPAGQWAEFP